MVMIGIDGYKIQKQSQWMISGPIMTYLLGFGPHLDFGYFGPNCKFCENQQKVDTSNIWPLIIKMRTLSFLQLLKLKKKKCA